MADEPRRSTPSILSPAPLLAVALLAAGVIVKNIPLETSRPPDSERRKTAILAAQDVEGRLWQDPFVAIDAEVINFAKERGLPTQSRLPRSSEDRRKLSLSDKAHQIEGDRGLRAQVRDAVEDGNEVTLLGAMVFGGAYPEDTENRRRNRVAVVSGLLASEFSPDDAEHLGYVWTDTLENPAGVRTLAGGGVIDERLPRLLPYEWFSQGANPKRKVLLLWLEDDAFGKRPLNQLSWLARRIACKDPAKNNADAGCALDLARNGMSIIGPAGSDTFTQIFTEANESGPPPAHLVRLAFFSPYATIASRTDDAGPGASPHIFRGEKWGRLCSMTRTIGGDDALMRALATELELRDVMRPIHQRSPRNYLGLGDSQAAGKDPARAKRKVPVIVAITERDTAYSNRLAALMKNAVRDKCGADQCDTYRYSYLRGLDGVLPESAAPAETGRRSSTGTSSPEELLKGGAPRERASGRGQFDYLRRLADDIDRQHGEDVRAIGIFGNDVYDKLIVLQALRDRFPHAIFFTTDLDARMMQPDQSAWTRNLVVGSNFGLSLHPTLQLGTAPFRDAYQTAGYLATLLALRARDEGPAPELVKKWIDPPRGSDGSSDPFKFEGRRIFEIGRTRAIELDGNGATDRQCDSISNCENIHGIRVDNFPSAFDPRTWTAFFLGVVLVLLSWRRPQAWLVEQDLSAAALKRNAGKWIGCLTLVGLAAIVMNTFWNMLRTSIVAGVGEPFLWTEGVSLWPAQVFRLTSIVLSVVFLVVIARSMRRMIADIEGDEMGIRPDPNFIETPRGADLWLRGPLRPYVGPGLDTIESDDGPTAPAERRLRIEALWAAFRTRLRLACAWRWITLVTGVICAMSLLAETGPFRIFLPARGTLVRATDQFIEFWFIALGALLLVAVVYVTRATRAFILRLAEEPSEWPDAVSDRFARSEGVPAEFLSEWMDFKLLVRVSATVSNLIYYPFVILALGVVARNSFFDATDFPISLQIVIGVGLLYALHNAYALRKAAEKARDTALEHYAGRIMRLNAGRKGLPQHLRGLHDPSIVAKQCNALVARIRNEEDGAFKPFTQQPLVKAILIPLGGFGGVSVAEYFALANL